jgi:hypothetical protein
MTLRIVPIEGVPTWDPNVQVDVLIWRDSRVVLALEPHFDDADQRTVVFEWTWAWIATVGYPNDEGVPEHPLYDAGLGRLTRFGEIVGGDLPREGLRRFIVPTKENLVDITARDFSVHRVDGSTLDAAHSVMSRDLS